MEVAGLVLGVVGTLPMIVKFFEGYRILAEIPHIKRHMDTLGQDIETERIILKNTYERLLDGIVPAWELDNLEHVENSTAKWRKYDDQIRLRLRDSYQDFHRRVKSIAEAVQDLKEKLAVTPRGEFPFKDWSSIKTELLSNMRVYIHFTLKKKDYAGTISKIHENNNLISRLVDHGSALEPTRRANSQASHARRIRTLAQNLFSSLHKALSCRCADLHEFGLHLVQRTCENKISPSDCVYFDTIFRTSHEIQGYKPIWKGLKAQWKEDESTTLEQKASREIYRSVDLLSLDGTAPAGMKEKPILKGSLGGLWSTLNRPPSSSKEKPRAKVSFSIPAATTSTGGTSTEQSGDSSFVEPSTLSQVTDLCADIQPGKVAPNQPIGSLPCDEKPKRFDLYHQESLQIFSTTASLTLRDVLSGKNGLIGFGLTERLNIALALSFNVLQLCNTPWLGEIISLDDIIFLREVGNSLCYTAKLEFPAPFLVCQSSIDRHRREQPRPVNFALLSFGVLLTHIIMGCTTEALDLNKDMARERLIEITDLAKTKLSNGDDVSHNYACAVGWCFNSMHCYTFDTLENEDLGRKFHDAVIARLQRDLSSIDYLSKNTCA